MTEDGLSWQYQLQIKYGNCKALLQRFNVSVLMFNKTYT